jgi:hypothetical protein
MQHVLVQEGESVVGVLQVLDGLRGAAAPDMAQQEGNLTDSPFRGMHIVVREKEAPHPIDPPLRRLGWPEALPGGLLNVIEEARW